MSDGILSQEELDALLQDHQQSEGDPNDEPLQDLNINNHLTAVEQDTLAEIGNISMGSAATALSTLVNRKVRITVPKVYLSTDSAIRESYPIPCIVVDVGYVEGLEGANILVIQEQDALVIGNLMMGEDGTNAPDALDDLYLSAVTEAMNMMMGSASTSMSELFGRSIEISPPNTFKRDLSQDSLTDRISSEKPVVAISFRMEINGLIDSTLLQVIDVDFAKDMAQSLLPDEPEPEPETELEEQLEQSVGPTQWADLRQQPMQTASSTAQQAEYSFDQSLGDLGNINIDLIRDIPVKVRAVLGRTKMSIDNILRLGPGHIMELESLHGEPIELFANDTLIAHGEVVVVGEQFGVRITKIATPQDRIVSIRS